MGDTLSVTLTNKPAEIERLGSMVEKFSEKHALPMNVVLDINHTLDELLTNTISYAYEDNLPHDILVTMTVEDGDIEIALEDDGRAYDPFTTPTPNLDLPLEDRAIGGLGVHFVRNLMDAFEYRREHDRNVVVLKKRIAS